MPFIDKLVKIVGVEGSIKEETRQDALKEEAFELPTGLKHPKILDGLDNGQKRAVLS